MENTFIQDSITDNKEIFFRVQTELRSAKSEILVAMAWFTDPELFNILESKLDDGLKVSIILSEHPDNDRLNFPLLESKGAEIVKIKNVGYGIMHQKFCVIDNYLAIAGSYNWSLNARNNNHEQVIVTTYSKTVAELIENFHDIKIRAMRLSQGEPLDEIIKSEKIIESIIDHQPALKDSKSIQEASIDEFKNVLDSIIAAEVGNFDKELLRETGYRRSLENNGDQQVLPQAMDSVYSSFINNIEVIEERKRKLSTKIEEQQRISTGSLESKIAFEENRLKEEDRVSIENCKKHIVDLQSQKETLELELKNNNKTRIPYIKERIEEIKAKIKVAEREFVKPRLNWPVVLTCSLFAIVLGCYIFTFYSSVAYIFIFAKQDAMYSIERGLSIVPPEIFDPRVFEKISNKGFGGFLFILFFVSIPFGLGLYHLFGISDPKSEKLDKWSRVGRWIQSNFNYFLILLIDGFIAFKVSKNINHVEYTTNHVDTRLGFWEIFASDNFWLVFILGALGIYLFAIVTKKLFSIFDERNATSAEKKNIMIIDQFQEDITHKLGEIHEVELENNLIEAKVATTEKEIEKYNLNLGNLPLKFNDAFTLLRQELEQGKERLINLANIYKSHIENDKLPISIPALDDRINVFMEGWSKYLHDKYSLIIAEKKTAEAIEEIFSWRQDKITSNKLTA